MFRISYRIFPKLKNFLPKNFSELSRKISNFLRKISNFLRKIFGIIPDNYSIKWPNIFWDNFWDFFYKNSDYYRIMLRKKIDIFYRIFFGFFTIKNSNFYPIKVDIFIEVLSDFQPKKKFFFSDFYPV